MIIWLASYPKSGNTFLRAFLSTYFFSSDGKFSFDILDYINQYPQSYFFQNLGIDINNKKEVAKNHLEAQKLINKTKAFKFLKTHSSFIKVDGNSFTDLNQTLGVIYIVRDPRDVVLSFAKHNNESLDTTSEKIKNNNILDANISNKIPVYMGSWSYNYNSWKEFKRVNRYFLIKYEDLILNKEKNFKKILTFIKNLTNGSFDINDKKIKKVIDEIEFDKMKNLEKKFGFKEAKKNKDGSLINFFNKGKIEQWKNNLDKKISKSIEVSCEKEMKELGYL